MADRRKTKPERGKKSWDTYFNNTHDECEDGGADIAMKMLREFPPQASEYSKEEFEKLKKLAKQTK